MALIFLGVLLVFTISSSEVSASQIALTSSLMMSGPSSPNPNSLDYQVWGKCWSLITSCNKSQKQFQSFKNALQMTCLASSQNAIDNSQKDHRKRLQACVSTNDGHFEHLM